MSNAFSGADSGLPPLEDRADLYSDWTRTVRYAREGPV